MASSKGNYEPQIEIAKKKTTQKAGYILRTFRNRSVEFFKFIYRSQIRPIMDYSSPIWAPTKLGQIDSLETVQNSFLRKIPALRNMHSWDRLKVMNITSVQRRMEHFIIIYTHKILSGVVPNLGGFNSKWTHRGSFIKIPPTPDNVLHLQKG